MTTQQIAEIVEKYEEEIKKLNIDLANLSYVVNHAKAIEELAETKPFLVDLRRSNHFNIGDKIIFFILDKEKEGSEPNILKRGFITGKVINGYRHHDGCVSAVADEKWHDGDYIQGRGTDWGASRGDFMLQSEFDYLMTHSDFLRLWLDTLYEFNSERGSYGSFKKAMLTQAK